MGERRYVPKKGKREAIIRESNFQHFHTKSTQSQNTSDTGMGAVQDVIVLQPHTSQFFQKNTDLLNKVLYYYACYKPRQKVSVPSEYLKYHARYCGRIKGVL